MQSGKICSDSLVYEWLAETNSLQLTTTKITTGVLYKLSKKQSSQSKVEQRPREYIQSLHRRNVLCLGLAESSVIKPAKRTERKICRYEKHFLPEEK